MSNEAVALIGFISLFTLMLLRVPVGMAMGLVGITGFGYLTGLRPGVEAGRPDHDAHGDGLFVRRDPDVPLDGRVRVGLRHQPRTVPCRQHLCRALEGRPRHRHHRRLRRLCGDFGLLGRDRRDLLGGGLSGNAPLRLSAILRHRRDRGRRHARRDAAAVDGARGLRHHHPAGHRQAVHRRHRAGTAGDLDAHDHHRHHRRGAARIPAGRAARFLARPAGRAARRLVAAAAVPVRDRRPLWRLLHSDRGRRGRRGRRLHHRHPQGQADQRRHPAVAAAGDAHRGRGLHRADRRACASAISSPSPRRRRT